MMQHVYRGQYSQHAKCLFNTETILTVQKHLIQDCIGHSGSLSIMTTVSPARSQHYRKDCRDCKHCKGKEYTSEQCHYKDSVANETAIWRHLEQVAKTMRIALDNIDLE